LISYSKAFNKKYNRRGSLFLDNIKRKPIPNKAYYINLIYYIHHNPVHHGFVDKPAGWPFSSYQIIISRKQTQLDRETVLEWFRGRKAFQEFHHKIHHLDSDELYRNVLILERPGRWGVKY